jgi:Fe-S oxidoreductase
MATYKSEALHQRYRRRLRTAVALRARPAAEVGPDDAAAAGQPDAADRTPRPAGEGGRRASTSGGGCRRFSERPLRSPRWSRSVEAPLARPDAVDVWVWADSFTDRFAADSGRAAVRLLEGAGLRVRVIPEAACCALTWITTRSARPGASGSSVAAVAALHPYVASGVPVVGLEPSCLATLRSDAEELLDGPPRRRGGARRALAGRAAAAGSTAGARVT